MPETPDPWLTIWDWDKPTEVCLTDGSGATVIVQNGHVRMTVTDTAGTTVEVPLTYVEAALLCETLAAAGSASYRAEHRLLPGVHVRIDDSLLDSTEDELFKSLVEVLDDAIARLGGTAVGLLREFENRLDVAHGNIAAEITRQDRRRPLSARFYQVRRIWAVPSPRTCPDSHQVGMELVSSLRCATVGHHRIHLCRECAASQYTPPITEACKH
ncbi:hypothetical protein [Nocardia sp. NPDC050435]|uniref:hypothetical protein n=1 Tax=Nocardia sp. NPDC050435 TaxID=3155040 RepID=UPI0033F8F241